MKCPDCASEMQPLFTSFFCPNECDLLPEKWSEKKKAGVLAKEAAEKEERDRRWRMYGFHPFFEIRKVPYPRIVVSCPVVNGVFRID